MTSRRVLFAAAVGILALAGCGGSGKHATSAGSGLVATSQSSAISPSTTSTGTTPTIGSKKPAKRRAETSVVATPHSTATARATTHSTATARVTTHARTSTTPGGAATTVAAATPKPKSPVPCMVRAGLQGVGGATQVGTWQGMDPASHRPIYVDGPYKSAAAARQAVSTLAGVSQAAPGGVWEVSASLRGDTAAAVHRVAACLGSV